MAIEPNLPVSEALIQSSSPIYPMPGPSEDPGAPNSRLNVRRFVFFLRRFWWVPVITAVLSLGGACGYVYYLMPPNFISRASMWETEKMKLPDGAAFTEDLQNYFGTQMALLQNSGMERRVVARLQAANTNAVPLDKIGDPIKVKIIANQIPKSSIFEIEANSSNPAYSQAYLDALLNEYLEYKKNVRKVVSGDTLASISEQVLRMETELKDEQAALTAFERTNNLAILQEEGTFYGGYLAKLQTELSDLKMESKLLDATSNQPQDSVSVTPATDDHLSPVQEVELLKSEREKLSKNLRPKHPKIVKLDAQIERDQKIIEMFHEQSQEQLAASRERLNTKMGDVVASIKEWEGKIVAANNRIAEAEHLKLSVDRTQTVYDRLSTLLQTVDISRNIDQETLTILDPASPSTRSHSDEISLVEHAGFGGIAFGLGIVALLGIRDDRINSLAEVNEKFGNVIVGQVPDMPAIRGNSVLPLLEIEDERDMYAESYRNLRSAILFMPSEAERPKILLVTSALPSEGKSTIAANLARTLALGGSRVLLVDADLRRGYLHDVLGMRQGPGLSDLLDKTDDLEAIIQHDSVPNFAFLSRGKSVPNPGDLFLTPKLDKLFARLREKYDYILIDSTPVFAADDVASLAPKTDGTLFVVRSRFSSAGAVKEALDTLVQRQARVLGVVFNRVDSSARSYHYYKNPTYYRAKTIS